KRAGRLRRFRRFPAADERDDHDCFAASGDCVATASGGRLNALQNITAICSMLHEPPAIHSDAPRLQLNSATRLFRGEPVLSWTMHRLTQSRHVGNLAVLCWEDQVPAVEEI